jgi:hypothetical protein
MVTAMQRLLQRLQGQHMLARGLAVKRRTGAPGVFSRRKQDLIAALVGYLLLEDDFLVLEGQPVQEAFNEQVRLRPTLGAPGVNLKHKFSLKNYKAASQEKTFTNSI